MTPLPTNVVVDHALADGLLHGFDATGALIVAMLYAPKLERLIGTADDEPRVTAWHVSPQGARRLAAIGAWTAYGNRCWGNA